MERRVNATRKDRDGDIIALCGGWESVWKAQAIIHIDSRLYRYFVQDGFGRQADVIVVNGPYGKYLRTDPNSSCSDNLDNLPNC